MRTLGRPEQAGEESLEASLRRRCRYQLRGTLGVPGRIGRVDGGRFGISFAIQSDGLRVDSTRETCSSGADSAHAAGVGRWCLIAMISSSPVGRAGTELRC